MSWKGFNAWIKKHQDFITVSLDQGMPEVAAELADKMLAKMEKVGDVAARNNARQQLTTMQLTFEKLLQTAKRMESELESEDAGPGENGYSLEREEADSPQECRIRGEGFLNLGLYEEALPDLLFAYHNGIHHIEVVQQIVTCHHQLGQPDQQASFLKQVLEQHGLRGHEQAKLYFMLGNLYLGMKKHVLARQAFWQLSQLDPDYPGLEDRMQQIKQVQPSYTHRYGFLIEEEMLSQSALDAARTKARQQNLHPDEILIKDFGISREDLGASLSAYYNVPFQPFDPTTSPPFELFEKHNIKAEFLKQRLWAPLSLEGNTVEVMMNDPLDMALQDEIRFILGTSRIVSKVALPSDIEAYVDDIFQKFHSSEELSALAQSFDVETEAAAEDMADDSEITEFDSEVVRLVNGLLMEAHRRNASDIHIEPNPRGRYLLIRLRTDGTCFEFQKTRLSLAKPILSRIKIMSHLDIAERRLPQDGKIKVKLPNRKSFVEFRVSTYPTVENYEDVVLRVLSSGVPLPLERLGMQEEDLKVFKGLLYRQHGLILVCGPTGSGKTTTLHSALSYINTPERKILTVEDPVEITQEGLRQVQVQTKIGLNFPRALRCFLRSDPDVIMVGEMRDQETARIGVEASLTGHLVFSTLHTNSAPETVTRLLDMDIDPFNFADSLICVLAQRLVKTLCPLCKEPYAPTRREFDELVSEYGPSFEADTRISYSPELTLYRPKGCPQCVKGYKGRLGVFELMVTNKDIRELIKFRKTTGILRDTAIAGGMHSLKQDGIHKVFQGVTDLQQVRVLST